MRQARPPARKPACRSCADDQMDVEQRHGGNFREHGDGTAPAHRAGHDGMQEGADRSGRRHGEGRGAAADQERRQGVEGGRPRRGGRRDRPVSSRRREVGAMVEVNCETDFVASNDDFRAFAGEVAQSSSPTTIPADVAALAARAARRAKRSKRARTALVQKIGENMSMRRFARIAGQGTARARTCTAAEDRRAGGRTRAATRRSARISRCTSPRRKPVALSRERRARRRRSRRSATIAAAQGRRIGQAREHRRKDGRRRASPSSWPR